MGVKPPIKRLDAFLVALDPARGSKFQKTCPCLETISKPQAVIARSAATRQSRRYGVFFTRSPRFARDDNLF